jgi:hypothetical protein
MELLCARVNPCRRPRSDREISCEFCFADTEIVVWDSPQFLLEPSMVLFVLILIETIILQHHTHIYCEHLRFPRPFMMVTVQDREGVKQTHMIDFNV